MAIDASRGVAFVVHELKSVVLTFSIGRKSGTLVLKGAVDILEHSPIPVDQHTWPFQV